MKKIESFLEEYEYTPCPNGLQIKFNNYTQEDVLDKVVEIAQENHKLKVYKHIVVSETTEDKTRPMKYYMSRNTYIYFTADDLLRYNYQPSIDSEPLVVYPTKIKYKVIVYLQ